MNGNLRRDFPILERVTYLDNAATTQKPKQVIEAIASFYETSNANIHRGIYRLSEEATEAYEAARRTVARHINAQPRQVIFTKGATESINLVAHALSRGIGEGDEILLTPLEHHANIVPWQRVAKERGATLIYAALNEDGTLDAEELKARIGAKTRVLAITHASNVLGCITPLKEILPYARERGVTSVVDGAQAVPHLTVDMQELKPDFYAFSGHKMLGPTGIGLLYMDARHLDMEPYQLGGDMIDDVTETEAVYARGEPRRFEAGTPNIGGVIGLAAAIEYLRALEHEPCLTVKAWEHLEAFGATLYGPDPRQHERVPVISFNLDGIHPHDVAQVLDEHGVAIRSGKHCAHPLMRRLGVAATNRVSFSCYNNEEDIEKLMRGLKRAREVLG